MVPLIAFVLGIVVGVILSVAPGVVMEKGRAVIDRVRKLYKRLRRGKK